MIGGFCTEVKFSKSAAKFINAADKPTKARMKESVDGLEEVPPKGDIKVMQSYHPTVYRLRVGKYRLVYEIITREENKPFIYIRDIDSRGDIYK